MYRLLFDSAKETLLEVAADPKHLGARIGVLMVLHTWGQQLEHHPHLHCVVPGGGLAVPEKIRGSIAAAPGDEETSGNTTAAAGDPAPRWVSCRPDWFLPVKVLSRVFRGKYLAGLRAAHQAGQLTFAGSTLPLASPMAWEALLRGLYRKEWVVYAKEPFGGPEHVLKYLTGYTHRVALSNRRLVQLEDDRVTFTWKDYADGCRRKEMTLEAVEFVRRFALHIVPKGMVRIRHYGLLAHRDRARGWRCAGRFWESGRSPGRRRRPRRHHNRRVVRDRPTAWRRPAERDRSRHGSSPGRADVSGRGWRAGGAGGAGRRAGRGGVGGRIPGRTTRGRSGRGRGPVPRLWRGSGANDLVGRPSRTAGTASHGDPGQLMTPRPAHRSWRWRRRPLGRGSVARAPRWAPLVMSPPARLVTVGLIALSRK